MKPLAAIWALTTLVVLTLVVLYSLAFGAPVFPFQNLAQLQTLIPGWRSEGAVVIGRCGEFFPVIVYSHRSEAGTEGWQTWVQGDGPHFTGAHYASLVDDARPDFVVFGTRNLDNDRLTVTVAEPFDSMKHRSPCQAWKQTI